MGAEETLPPFFIEWRWTPVTVIPMGQEHIAAVAALEQACFSAPWSAAALAEELDNPPAVFRVAVEGDTVLGYVGMHHVLDEGFITNVAVSPEARRRGVARALLADLAARVVLRPIELSIGVVTSLVGAVAFVLIFARTRKGGT